MAKFKEKTWWWVLFIGGTAGMLASFIQTVERINYAKAPTVALSCDINSVFSCANVFDAWQSSVFGFSNSLMCIVFFTLILGVALAGLTGSKISAKLRLFLQFLSLFFLGFGAWYLWQSAYRIGTLCIFCTLCYGAVIALNWAWLRLNLSDLPISAKTKKSLQHAQAKGADTFFWLLYAILFSAIIAWRFI